jgi:hypothetical protein
LWRAIAGTATLHQLREDKPKYFRGLREFLVCLHYGKAAVEDAAETQILLQAANFTRVIFGGGDALHPEFEPILRAKPLPFSVEIGDGLYAARRGALHLFEAMGWHRGVALDLGQLQLKVMTAEQNHCLARDPSFLPFGARALDAAIGQERLRQFLKHGLAGLRPDGVVLALPVALDRAGRAQSSTYPGLFGRVEPIFAELFDCPWVVLNDAVLAALGFRPETRDKTLIVTLGFGLGGALWHG